MHVTKLSATGDILIAEEYTGGDEPCDPDPETGEARTMYFTAEDQAEARAIGLHLEREDDESVLISEDAYAPPETPTDETVEIVEEKEEEAV